MNSYRALSLRDSRRGALCASFSSLGEPGRRAAANRSVMSESAVGARPRVKKRRQRNKSRPSAMRVIYRPASRCITPDRATRFSPQSFERDPE